MARTLTDPRTGTLGPDPLDSDLTARIEGVRDLILTAGSRSDGSGRLGARGGGAGHRSLVSAVARGSGSPDFAKSDAPVAKSSGAFWYLRYTSAYDI
jgi:hypothetical protein